MPRNERRARWQRMSEHLQRHSIHRWFSDFLGALKSSRLELPQVAAGAVAPLKPSRREDAIAAGR
jgi:trehalose-6-phosphate synthase